MSEKVKIGVLGSGDVGRTLAQGFAGRGHPVMVGTREPIKLEAWRAATAGAVSVGRFAEAAAFGSVVVLATHGAATLAAIDLAGVEHFSGKLVLDATNPLDFSQGMPPTLFVGTTTSLGEMVQHRLPSAHVVKCFNTVGHQRMVDPAFTEGHPSMLICGNDPHAKAEAEALVRELGWPGALDVGGIDAARWLEALVPLWVRIGAKRGTFDHMLAPVR